jgi:hypothetical protein
MSILALQAEYAIAQAATVHVDSHHPYRNQIIINQPNLLEPLQVANQTRAEIEEFLAGMGYSFNRYINANVAFITADHQNLEILIEPSAPLVNVDRVWIRTPYYNISFTHSFMVHNAQTPLTITTNSFINSPRTYSVEFSRPVTEPIRLSVPTIQGDPTYQTLQQISPATGQAQGISITNHNPVSGQLEARISQSGTYTVISNRIDFADIQGRSEEMQRAIRILASQGVISGITDAEFRPDDPLNRAQVAMLITRLLGISDSNADGGFADVQRSDWFFGAVGTATRNNLMAGTAENRFDPHLNIPRDQMLAISARVLRREMNYHNPAVPMNYLNVFADHADLAEWSIVDISLAARENLVIRRADRNLQPRSTITRGEASIILYRLYRRIW